MAKKVKPIILPPVPKMTKKALAEEKPLKVNLTADELLKKILNSQIKKNKK
ncbi:MAG: hypothetical protein U1C70_06850 [Sediminibacterium sp.]|jgi:hypothetical protein|uniref:hypothetical protein n=1 Tax=Sediminibacterium sp. TaxID=1917865 RepID=UPI002ABA57B6|nr:hypothetical protein [Sediminibacterium sp.]MDZ4071523.1 hypothetical protein [Sediminibacterium sp.]